MEAERGAPDAVDSLRARKVQRKCKESTRKGEEGAYEMGTRWARDRAYPEGKGCRRGRARARDVGGESPVIILEAWKKCRTDRQGEGKGVQVG